MLERFPATRTPAEFMMAFEREGILTMAMRLPRVRQALTVVLVPGISSDKDTGEAYLDLDEEALI